MAQTTEAVLDDSDLVDNDKSVSDEGNPVLVARKQVPKQREFAWGYRSDRQGQARTDYVGQFKNASTQTVANGDRIVGTWICAYTNFNEEEGFKRQTTFDSENVNGDSQPFPVVGEKIGHPHYIDVYFKPRRLVANATDDLSTGEELDISETSLTASYSQRNL